MGTGKLGSRVVGLLATEPEYLPDMTELGGSMESLEKERLGISLSFVDWPDDQAVYGTFIIFLPGCDNLCEGCHNLRLKEHTPYDEASLLVDLADKLRTNPVRHLVISGGDPLSVDNIKTTITLLDLFPGVAKTVYTGHGIQKVSSSGVQGKCQYIKSGPFVKSLAQTSGHFGNEFRLASTNQQILDGDSLEILSSNGIFHKQKRR